MTTDEKMMLTTELLAAVATVVDALAIRDRNIDDATACERLLII